MVGKKMAAVGCDHHTPTLRSDQAKTPRIAKSNTGAAAESEFSRMIEPKTTTRQVPVNRNDLDLGHVDQQDRLLE